MADHTIVNLLEVEDAAKKFGMPPGLEARFARSALGLEKSGVTLFKAGPDFKVPWGHRHRDQEEVYLVLRGSATVGFDGDGGPPSWANGTPCGSRPTGALVQVRSGRGGGARVRRRRAGRHRDDPGLLVAQGSECARRIRCAP